MKRIALFLVATSSCYYAFCQTVKSIPVNDPASGIFHTEDIDNFWKVYDNSYPKHPAQMLKREYLDKGSAGLKGFFRYRIENGRKLSKTIRQNRKYYEGIRQASLSIGSERDHIYTSFLKLKEVYPSAVFPNVYFVIGRNNSGGTSFKNGLIIGAEKFGNPTANFKPGVDIQYLDEIVVHELIHFQQNYPLDQSLLAQCIKEGAADFLCELLTGTLLNGEMYRYGEENKSILWKEFLERNDQTSWKNWLYYQKDKSRPSDLGYWVGYKICKSYYDKMEDKNRAIHDILNITDFNDFLNKSGYQGQ